MTTLAALAALALLATPEPPDDAGLEYPDAGYRGCVENLRRDVEAGRTEAARWIAQGGGAPALHCQALGDLAAGKPRLAGVRLAEIAERSDAGDALMRARLLGQAALAFVEAEDFAAADNALKAAYALAPEGGELDLVAARVALADGRNQAAADAVTKAETAGLVSPAGYVVRARANIALQQTRAAADDVVSALSLDPLNVDALTVRGELAALGVDIDIRLKEKPKTR